MMSLPARDHSNFSESFLFGIAEFALGLRRSGNCATTHGVRQSHRIVDA
jgi:hypothetical protein